MGLIPTTLTNVWPFDYTQDISKRCTGATFLGVAGRLIVREQKGHSAAFPLENLKFDLDDIFSTNISIIKLCIAD